MQFVRGTEEDSKLQPGKHDWALFLCTDTVLSPEIYALRWGLLKEQTITSTSHLASISLTAIRYLMLLYAALEQDKPFREVRTGMSTGLVGLSFGQRLWGLFRCLISNTIEQFRTQLGDMADLIMSTLEENINTFFIQALQLDSFTLELEARQDNDSAG